MHVGWQQGFVWREGPAQEALSTTVNALQEQLGYLLPSGYESEVNPRLDAWIASLAETMEAGALLFIDYGYPRRAYYHPQRSAGTLLSHYRHRAHDDILFLPGLQDITANVDFTALADAGLASGLRVAGYTSQSYFLFGCGLMDLLDEVDPADTVRYTERARQAKLLTLPGEMGERFKVWR
jgi:SAM-dependent MidA family methyltransferase